MTSPTAQKPTEKERRIRCKFCGAKLTRDIVGWRCPTQNCQWEHGVPDKEME